MKKTPMKNPVPSTVQGEEGERGGTQVGLKEGRALQPQHVEGNVKAKNSSF